MLARFRSSPFWRWRPIRMDAYILSELAGPLAGGVLFFLFVFLMAQTLRWAELIIVHGVSMALVGKMAFSVILTFFPMTVPPAYLVAVLAAFGRLSTDSEWTALKASGFSLRRLMAPVLTLGFVLSAFCLALNLEWGPSGERELYRTVIRIGNTGVSSSIRQGAFISGFFDLLLFTDRYDPKTQKMKKVFIFDERDPKQPVAVVAPEGELVPLKTKNETDIAYMLKLYSGNIHRNDPKADSYSKIDFGEYRLFLKLAGGTSTGTEKPRMFSYDSLKEQMESPSHSAAYRAELRVELWRRVALSVAPLVFGLIGVAFGIVPTRSVRSSAALVGLGSVLVYWGLLSLSVDWGTFSNADYAAWILQIPNLVLLAIGGWVLQRGSQ
jgi:lipopolysaccharide export system permease protein